MDKFYETGGKHEEESILLGNKGGISGHFKDFVYILNAFLKDNQ